MTRSTPERRSAGKSGRATEYVPDGGDIVWFQFDPRAGREQAGRGPALVLSPRADNRGVGLALFCRVASRGKSYPFEVVLSEGFKVRASFSPIT